MPLNFAESGLVYRYDRCPKGTGLAEQVMHILHSVKGELILSATVIVKPLTDLIIQVEQIAKNAPM